MFKLIILYHYIYKTVNQITGTYYIGCHSCESLENNYLGSGRVLNRSIKKYGPENFKKDILLLCKDVKSKFYYESLIVTEELLQDPLCMNLKTGGKGGCGTHSEKTKQKMRDAQLGEKNPMYGKKLSDETRKKMSITRSGEKHPFYGKIHSEETKKKISESKKGKPLSDETKQKLSIALSNHVVTEETKKKISASRKNKQLSEETKKKISITLTGKFIGDKNPFYGKRHTEETKKKISESKNIKKTF